MSKTWMGVIVGVVASAVGIAGTYVYMQNKLNSETEKGDRCVSEEITSASPVATTNASTSDETADWKTYTNEKYGYSFKYPSEYFVKDTCGSQTSEAQKDNEAFVLVSKKELDKSIPDCASYKDTTGSLLTIQADKDTLGDRSGGLVNSSTKVVGKQTWAQYIFQFDPNSTLDGNQNGTLLAIPYGGSHYDIYWLNSDAAGSHDALIDQILSTFQFTK